MKNAKMKMLLASLMLGLGTVQGAYAQGGDKIGGGGDVLICTENGSEKYYLLDMFEARMNGKVLDLGSSSLSIEEKIAYAEARFSEIDPVRSAAYAVEARKMMQDIEAQEQGKTGANGLVALVPQELKDIDDANEIFTFQDNCKKAQLVRQEKPLSPMNAFYTIDQNYWSKLDADQKVATLYHEVIYKEMRSKGATISKGARALNGMIMTGMIQNVKSGDYRQFLLSQGLNSYVYGGFEIGRAAVEIDQNHEISRINSKFNYQMGVMQVDIQAPQFKNRRLVSAELGNNFTWDKDKSKLILRANTPIYGEARGLLTAKTIEVLENGTYALNGMTKSDDAGVVNLVIDHAGNILSRQETGLFKIQSAPTLKSFLNSLVVCSVKRVKKNKNIDVLASILDMARDALANGDETQLKQLVEACEKNSDVVAKPMSSYVKNWLNAVKNPEATDCHGYAMTAQAAIGLGVKVGAAVLICDFSDEVRRTYLGPHLGIQIGIGGGVMVGGFKVSTSEQHIGKNLGILAGSRDQAGIPFVSLPEAWIGQQQVAFDGGGGGEIDEANEFGLGLNFVGMMGETVPLVRIHKSKPQYSNLANTLLDGLLVEIK